MTGASEYAVLEGRRWAISEAALADLARDHRWVEWDEKPVDGRPDTVFACVLNQVFDRQLDLMGALTAAGVTDVPTQVIDALLFVTFECPPTIVEPDDPAVRLYRTDTGQRLHLPGCSHVRGADIIEVTPEQRQSRAVCNLSQAELDGVGRTHFETIADALQDTGAPQHARPELARLLNEVEWDVVYTPNSKSYAAVTRNGRIVASAGKTYVYYPDRPIVYLPDYLWAEGGGSSATQTPLRGDRCPKHPWYERSVTGACPECG